MIELRPVARKSYLECIQDIDRVVSLFPARRYHFFFEFSGSFDYCLRVGTQLSCDEAVELVEGFLNEKFTAAPYVIESENFKGAIGDCYVLFGAVSRIALKIALLKDKGKRIEADDILHLVANVLSGSLEDEARLCRVRAMRADPSASSYLHPGKKG